MPGVIHFELPADRMDRASKFYAKVFGWRIQKEDGLDDYRTIETSDDEDLGITGGLVERTDPSDATLITIDVSSVDEFARKITEAGGKVLTPKTAIPAAGYLQYCQDTEGNVFAIMEFDESAE